MKNKLIKRYDRLENKQKEEFKRIFNEDQPLGPFYFNVEDKDTACINQVFFDDNSDCLYKNEKKAPSLVVGRRGSGKTTYINNLFQRKVAVIPNMENLPIVLQSWALIREMTTRLIELRLMPGQMIPEEGAKLWELVFLLEVIRHLMSSDDVKVPAKLHKYVAAFALAEVSSGVTGLVQSITALWKNSNDIAGNIVTVSGLVNKIMDSAKGFFEIRKDVNDALYELKLAAVILLDNIESPPESKSKNSLEVAEFVYTSEYYTDDALAGLLQLCTTLNSNPSSYIQIRMCIPSEQYKHYLERASQPERLGYRHLLHWRSSDLLSMVANKIILFGHIYPEHFPEGVYETLIGLDLYDKKQLTHFFKIMFPCKIENRRSSLHGFRKEDPITYIIRHTQLLPRQIIRYINDILSKNIENEQSVIVSKQLIIKDSITRIETELAKEIARSYEHSYECSSKIVAMAMTKFPLIFNAQYLESIYKNYIMKDKDIVDAINNSNKLSAVNSPSRFIRMLEEMGAIGKVIGTPEKYRYVNAEFEYNIDGNLVTNNQTEYSPHPLFSHNIESRALNSNNHLPILGIYPKESDSEHIHSACA